MNTIMDRLVFLIFFTIIVSYSTDGADTKPNGTLLSTILTPDTKEKTLSRQSRSYYDPRYGAIATGPYYGVRPLYDRLEYARPEYDRPRCTRCYDDRYDDRDRDRDRDDYDRGRDRNDDDRRERHRPTYGNRYDKNKNNGNDDDEDRRYNSDRKGSNKNGTDDSKDGDKKGYDDDDKDNRPSGSRRGGNRDRKRPDDRDRYRPDYYDRFLRDPYRDRGYDDPYYRERRPLYDRYPPARYPEDPYYDGRNVAYGFPGNRQPLYEDRFDRGNGYDDRYGGYGPGAGRGPHDSFRPWDETYRGQAGWDAGGRGYYFAGGRPDAAPAAAWGRPEYARPEVSNGWQNQGYQNGYRDQQVTYGATDQYRPIETAYGPATGWQSVGERRPYRDQSGVNSLDQRESYGQSTRKDQRYGQGDRLGDRQQAAYGQGATYAQGAYNQGGSYNQGTSYNQGSSYSQPNTFQSSGSSVYTSSTTPQTSYLYQRDQEQVTVKTESSTKPPS